MRELRKKEIITSAFLGNNQANVGGYSTIEDLNDGSVMRGSADFVSNEEVVKLAEKNDIKWIHLAGDWRNKGRKGFGEVVSISNAKKLLKVV